MRSQGRISAVLSRLAVVGTLLVTAACSGAAEPEQEPTAPATSPGFPRTVTHAMGTTEIPARPERVVALDNTLSGAVLLLGTELVGYTTLQAADEPLPEYLGADAERFGANAVPVGMLTSPNLEAIAALEPDVILSAKVRHADLYDELSSIAPTVFSETTGGTWKDNVRLAGQVLGSEARAEEEIAAFEARAQRVGDAIRAEVGRNPVVSVVRFVDGPTRLYTENTYSGVVLADAGLARPPSQQGGDDVSAGQVEISAERILDADADHIFVTAYPDGSGASAANRQRFESNPLWGRLTGEIHEVSDLTWMSAVGMQGAHAILDDLAATFGVDPSRTAE
ncbi:MAG TPA: iron-siderophore ABC transporter substrate-binding protein [Pseudonocardia sp.]|nr:iron-siderophore ABC transporter substrate-binding protein [Pseudonocardia sp.]